MEPALPANELAPVVRRFREQIRDLRDRVRRLSRLFREGRQDQTQMLNELREERVRSNRQLEELHRAIAQNRQGSDRFIEAGLQRVTAQLQQIANARSVDLTQQLDPIQRELEGVRGELQQLRNQPAPLNPAQQRPPLPGVIGPAPIQPPFAALFAQQLNPIQVELAEVREQLQQIANAPAPAPAPLPVPQPQPQPQAPAPAPAHPQEPLGLLALFITHAVRAELIAIRNQVEVIQRELRNQRVNLIFQVMVQPAQNQGRIVEVAAAEAPRAANPEEEEEAAAEELVAVQQPLVNFDIGRFLDQRFPRSPILVPRRQEPNIQEEHRRLFPWLYMIAPPPAFPRNHFPIDSRSRRRQASPPHHPAWGGGRRRNWRGARNLPHSLPSSVLNFLRSLGR